MSKPINRGRPHDLRRLPAVAGPMAVSWRECLGLTLLRDFFQELQTYRVSLEAGEPPALAEFGHVSEEFAHVPPPEALHRALLATLRRQEAEAARAGGNAALELYREAQFSMAALADEVLLTLNWSGREDWAGHLLEQALFGTNYAGEVVFERMDELLRQRDGWASKLAPVYLQLLALGFQGRYRDAADPSPLAAYRRRLYNCVTGSTPDLAAPSRVLALQTGAHTLTDPYYAQLPNLRRWYALCAGVALCLLLVSHLTWHSLLNEVQPLVQQILHPVADSSEFPG